MTRWLSLLVLLAALALPAAALADGDPASDFLYTGSLFLPLDGSTPAASAAQLKALIADAKAKGFPVRVAVIKDRTDLGAVPSLYERPDRYAPFLGQELRFLFKGPLLIVMPNGYGFYWHGRKVAAEQAALAALPKPAESADLARAAVPAIQALAEAHGIRLATPPLGSGDGNPWRDRILIVAGAMVLIAAVSIGARYRSRPRSA